MLIIAADIVMAFASLSGIAEPAGTVAFGRTRNMICHLRIFTSKLGLDRSRRWTKIGVIVIGGV